MEIEEMLAIERPDQQAQRQPQNTRNAFELQAIASSSGHLVRGYEFLFRGTPTPASPEEWRTTDERLVRHLANSCAAVDHMCFVNLSHESLLQIPDSVLIAAAKHNEVCYEISEAIASDTLFKAVGEKVNRLTAGGLKFALDDYGSGFDGSRRLAELDSIYAVKVDRGLLVSASKREHAAHMLQTLVNHWNSTGVRTIAEGIETPALYAFAQVLGFSMVQGYYVDDLCQPKACFF